MKSALNRPVEDRMKLLNEKVLRALHMSQKKNTNDWHCDAATAPLAKSFIPKDLDDPKKMYLDLISPNVGTMLVGPLPSTSIKCNKVNEVSVPGTMNVVNESSSGKLTEWFSNEYKPVCFTSQYQHWPEPSQTLLKKRLHAAREALCERVKSHTEIQNQIMRVTKWKSDAEVWEKVNESLTADFDYYDRGQYLKHGQLQDSIVKLLLNVKFPKQGNEGQGGGGGKKKSKTYDWGEDLIDAVRATKHQNAVDKLKKKVDVAVYELVRTRENNYRMSVEERDVDLLQQMPFDAYFEIKDECARFTRGQCKIRLVVLSIIYVSRPDTQKLTGGIVMVDEDVTEDIIASVEMYRPRSIPDKKIKTAVKQAESDYDDQDEDPEDCYVVDKRNHRRTNTNTNTNVRRRSNNREETFTGVVERDSSEDDDPPIDVSCFRPRKSDAGKGTDNNGRKFKESKKEEKRTFNDGTINAKDEDGCGSDRRRGRNVRRNHSDSGEDDVAMNRSRHVRQRDSDPEDVDDTTNKPRRVRRKDSEDVDEVNRPTLKSRQVRQKDSPSREEKRVDRPTKKSTSVKRSESEEEGEIPPANDFVTTDALGRKLKKRKIRRDSEDDSDPFIPLDDKRRTTTLAMEDHRKKYV